MSPAVDPSTEVESSVATEEETQDTPQTEPGEAGEAAPDEQPPSSPGRRRRRRRSSSSISRKYEEAQLQLRRFRIALAVLGGILALSLFGHLLVAFSQNTDLDSMRDALAQGQAREADLREQLRLQQAELQTLLRERIPSLYSFQPGEPLQIDQSYVKSVTLSVMGGTMRPRLEYQIVLENEEARLLIPTLELTIFDRRGFELANHAIGPGHAGHTTRSLSLAEGDVRTIYGGFTLDRGDHPAHLMIVADGERLATSVPDSEEAQP